MSDLVTRPDAQTGGKENSEDSGKETREENQSETRTEIMKLASYIADGKPAFGVVTEMGVITLSDRLRGGSHATLKDALAEDDALDEMLQAGGRCRARSRARRSEISSRHHQSRQDSLRRDQLSQPRGRARPRGRREAQHLHQIHRHAVRARRRDVAPESVAAARFRGRAGGHHRQGWPRDRSQERALTCRGLYLLLRRVRARFHQGLAGHGEELSADEPARPVDGDGGRNPRSVEAHADDAAERRSRCSIPAPTC